MCSLTRNSFGVDDISDREILKRLDSSVIVVPKYNNETLGFFSTDILKYEDLFGIYNSAGVIKKEYQREGLYQKIRTAFTTNKVNFVTTRTQNIAVYKSFLKQFPNSMPVNILDFEKKKLVELITKFLDCEDLFDSETFICKNAYEGSRNNSELIEGLNSTDAQLLLYYQK